MPLCAGDLLGPYEIIEPTGAGGMGEVYKARDKRLGRTVAIKTLNGEHGDRFEREARAIAAGLILGELEAIAAKSDGAAGAITLVNCLLGNLDETVHWAERAIAQRAPQVLGISD
jgi:serine/threonine protein kinase